MPGHGERNNYLLVNEEIANGELHERVYLLSSSGYREHLPLSIKESLALSPPVAGAQTSFKFGWMFEKDKAPIKDTKDCIREHRALIKLGRLMNKPPQNSGTASGTQDEDDSGIPSGYTYFGQFLAHEITFDGIPFVPQAIVPDLQSIPQKRSPSIDCDSLYGAGPDTRPELYEEESDHSRVRLKIGETVQSGAFKPSLQRDLPRDKKGPRPCVAVIGDERNDVNLPLAQMHVAFILFHNKVVNELELSKQYSGKELFEKAREQVVRHLQWIVLYDYLPRIIEEDVLNEVVAFARANDGRLKYFNVQKEDMFMPVEFSVAAFRLGHSMIRKTYEWNHFHKTKKDPLLSGPATLTAFFIFTGFSGNLDDKNQLMSEWIVDWKRFFDFSEIGENPNGLIYNRARKIDTKFDFHLDELAGYRFHEKKKKMRPITVRNLVRGYALRLPTGQAVANKIGLPADERLTLEEITGPPDSEIAQVLKKSGLDQNTPLWYYILKEAERFHKGCRLGPVGSRIVAETFVGIIWNSDHSILKDGGTPVPALGNRKAEGKFDMIDMLKYTFDKRISPVEDKNE